MVNLLGSTTGHTRRAELKIWVRSLGGFPASARLFRMNASLPCPRRMPTYVFPGTIHWLSKAPPELALITVRSCRIDRSSHLREIGDTLYQAWVIPMTYQRNCTHAVPLRFVGLLGTAVVEAGFLSAQFRGFERVSERQVGDCHRK